MKKIIISLLCPIMLMVTVFQGFTYAEENSDPFFGLSEINIAFIGGSITEGYGATTYPGIASLNDLEKDGSLINANGYAGLIYNYFKEKYPDKKVNFYNAGMSGTNSNLGLFRLQSEIMEFSPDMLFVEFAVNDKYNASNSKKYMEAIVRECLKAEKTPVINFIYATTKKYDAIGSAQHEVAEYYGIPEHDVQTYIKQQVSKGRYTINDVLKDDAHPNDDGYKIYADFIINNLKKRDGSYFVKPEKTEKTKFGGDFNTPRIDEAKNAKVGGAWSKETIRGRECLITSSEGATLTYEFYGECIGIMNLCGPQYAKAEYSIDGGKKKGIITQNGAENSFNLNFFADGLTKDMHTIELKVIPGNSNVVGFGVGGFLVDDYGRPEIEKDDEADINVSMGVTDIYVSPEGNDSNDGSFEKPLKTLNQAKNAAVMLSSGAESDINVILRSGTYNPGEGLSFDKNSSGTASTKINFKAYNGEKVYISNAITLDNKKFQLVNDEETLKRIPDLAKGKVYSVHLPSVGVTDFGMISRDGMQYAQKVGSRSLMINDSMYQLARWPNAGYASIKESFAVSSGHKFSYSENVGDRWATATEPWVYGFFNWLWADDSLTIKEIDTTNKTISTSAKHYYGMMSQKPYFIYNLLEELDSPGEWFLDSKTGVLYVYPKTDIKNAEIKFSPYDTPLVTVKGAKHITFTGITFEDTCGVGVNITDGEGIVMDNCEFRNIGQQAVNMTGKNNGVKNSHIHDIGRGGVFIPSGDTKNLTKGNNYIENCHIERFALTTHTYTPAVKLYGVGDRVSHCEINNAVHMGVYFLGSHNTIEYNEIYNVLQYSNDMGAIYGGRSWTAGGNVIRYNYIHDCKGADMRSDDVWFTQGVYLDDGIADVDVYGNVFDTLNNGVFSHYGRYSDIKGNIFLNCEEAVVLRNKSGSTNAKGLDESHEKIKKAFEEGGYEATKSLVADGLYKSYTTAKNMNWNLYVSNFPWLDNIFSDQLEAPKHNVISGNIIVGKKGVNVSDYSKDINTVENNYQTTEMSSFEELASCVEGFELLDLSRVGRICEDKKPVGNFMTLYPENGAKEISSENVVLLWEPTKGASEYTITVAEDSEFKKLVLFETVISNYRMMPKLKSGGQKYYWKVEAASSSDNYDTTPVVNSNGVQSFRTVTKDNVDKKMLSTLIDESWKIHDSAVEGAEEGQYIEGSKAEFRDHIEVAESVLEIRKAHSPMLSMQMNIDNAVAELEKRRMYFINSKTTQIVDIKALLTSSDEWSSKSVEIGPNYIKHSGTGAVGYTKKKLENYKKVKFRATFEPGSSWSTIGLRTGNTTVTPWTTACYVFLVKKDVIELQKFNGSSKWLHSVKNDCLQEGTEHLVEFGAITEGDNVRVTLVVDGKEIFNVLDEENVIADSGYFSIYNAGESTVTLRSAE